jgi:hypothetical protein
MRRNPVGTLCEQRHSRFRLIGNAAEAAFTVKVRDCIGWLSFNMADLRIAPRERSSNGELMEAGRRYAVLLQKLQAVTNA